MNNFFSNLQDSINQNSQKNQQNSVLQNQKNTSEKLNLLLEQASQALSCGPTCQKLKNTEELKQKYLDAQTNLQMAPLKLEESKKNYYVYSEGRPYYDNMLEDELKTKADTISTLLLENFNKEVTNANVMNTYFNNALLNSENSKDLLTKLLDENGKLYLDLRSRKGDIITNDRKTYYETEAISGLNTWYNVWKILFYIFVIIYAISLFYIENEFSIYYKIILLLLLCVYPYIIYYTIKWIFTLIYSIYTSLPKNIYNNI
jgi:hypothetical protein